MDKTVVLENRFTAPVYPTRGISIAKGEGSYLVSESGEKYLDMMSNFGASSFGHANSELAEILHSQFLNLANLHGSFSNQLRAKVSKDLATRTGYYKVGWTSTGAETVEFALKIALSQSAKNGNRKGQKILALKSSYHGKTLGALATTDSKPEYKVGLENILLKCDWLDLAGDISTTISEIEDDNYSAFIFEPIQGESGIIPQDRAKLAQIIRAANTSDTAVIADEIQTGSGRTGRFLATETLTAEYPELAIDLVTLSKGLGAGMPVGAVLIDRNYCSGIGKGLHTSTFAGSPLALAAVDFVLQKLTPEFLEEIKDKGAYFRENLESVMEVRGEGLMLGIKVTAQTDQLATLKALQKGGLLAIPAGTDVIRFLPAYTISYQELDNAIRIIKKCMN